jgi:alpha-tubulin suppressor-like RCC1 family protein
MGCNDFGQRGDAIEACRDAFAPVALPGRAVNVRVGADRGCAVLADGRVACWGANRWGALGDNVARHASCPRAVIAHDCSSTPVIVRELADAVEVAVADDHACARRRSGHVACWGMNHYGQLGDGGRTDRPAPVMVAGLDDAVQIETGYFFTCARRIHGQVMCWGVNTYGELGDGREHQACEVSHDTTDEHGNVDCSPAPVEVAGLRDAARLAVGSAGACAVRASGAVVCWGHIPGEEPERSMPGSLAAAPVAADIAIGEDHACALKLGGGIRCWGRVEASAPTAGVHGLLALRAGGSHTCVLSAAGQLVCW